MNIDELKQINHQRLDGWKKRLNEHFATPVILIGVMHKEKKPTPMVLCTEDMTDAQIILFLENALRQLRGY